MGAKVGEVSDYSFEEEVIKSPVPVLVDFWAPWCAPCRLLAPVIDQIAEKYQAKAKIVKLNVDENNQTASKYDIRGIPTLLLFQKGAMKEQIVGNTTADTISKMLDGYVD